MPPGRIRLMKEAEKTIIRAVRKLQFPNSSIQFHKEIYENRDIINELLIGGSPRLSDKNPVP